MRIYPAIDLLEGKVVRLRRGDYGETSVYGEDPAGQALEWEKQGAEWIHIVDLDGARQGKVENFEAVQKIRAAVSCKIQLGGGIRTIEEIERLSGLGVDRMILGTKALEGGFFREVMDRFGGAIAVSVDVSNGEVKTSGWLESSGKAVDQVIAAIEDFGPKTLIYTDIQRDGMLKGPNLKELRNILQRTKARVILAGGVSSLEDIRQCRAIAAGNFEGVIIGKALYEKRVGLREAIQLAAKEEL